MAFIHGKNTVFKLDNAAGVLTDLSAYINEVGLPRSVETHETTAFGKSAKTYVPGLSDATIPLSGSFDPTLDTHMAALMAAGGQLTAGGSISFEYGPAGNTAASGMPKYTGEAYLTSYEVSDPVGDVITWSAELQVTDVITRATY